MRGTLVLIVILFVFLTASFILWRKRTRNVDQVKAQVESYWGNLRERRKFIRFKKRLNVVCGVPEKKGSIYHTFSKDISGEGICLQVEEILPEKTFLELKVYIPNNKAISVKGEVAWVSESRKESPDSGRLFDTGVKFVKIDAKDKEILGGFLDSALKNQNAEEKEG